MGMSNRAPRLNSTCARWGWPYWTVLVSGVRSNTFSASMDGAGGDQDAGHRGLAVGDAKTAACAVATVRLDVGAVAQQNAHALHLPGHRCPMKQWKFTLGRRKALTTFLAPTASTARITAGFCSICEAAV